MKDKKDEEKSTFEILKDFWSPSKSKCGNCEKKEQEYKNETVQEIKSSTKNVSVMGYVEKINSTNSQMPSQFANPTKTNYYTVDKKSNFTFAAILAYWLGLENAHKIPKKILKIANKGTLTISLPYAVNQERGFFGVDFTNSNGKKLCTIVVNEHRQALALIYHPRENTHTTIYFPHAWQYMTGFYLLKDYKPLPEKNSYPPLGDEVPERNKDEEQSTTTLPGDSEKIWQKEVMERVINDLKNRIWYYKLFGSNKVTNLENIFNKSSKETIDLDYKSFQTAAKKPRFFGKETRSYKYLKNEEATYKNNLNGSR